MTQLERNQEDGKYFEEQLGGRPGFIVTYQCVTPESAEDGECSDHGFEDYHVCEPDSYELEDGETAVSLAIKRLRDEGATEASSSSFHVGIWYSTESQVEDYGTAEEKSLSFNLRNFTEAQEAEIFQAIKGRKTR